MNATHQYFMSLALQLAERGRLTVSPNPMVGCVIVQDNQVVGQGYHQFAGQPHAEVFALNDAGSKAQGATLYVTLEPCCHDGRTPPCVDGLIQTGIKKVYVACLDPNPRVAGKGIQALRAAGIQVEVGLCEQAALQLNEIFFHYIQHQRPFVIAKWAMSLDGKTIVNQDDDRQISCLESTNHTHHLRQQVDAILVGARTVTRDNPSLTVRSSSQEIEKQPLRVILAGHETFPPNLNLFNGSLPGKTLIVATPDTASLCSQFETDTVSLCVVPENLDKQICLQSLLVELGQREITSLLVEGGMTVHENFFKENLINKMQVYLSPVFIGKQTRKQSLQISDCFKIGSDFHLIANTKEVSDV